MNTPVPRILLTDDDPRNLMFLKGLLLKEGYRIFEAENGMRALEIAENENPDVILLDVMMPDMDGFEVCRRLRAHPKLSQVPILLLTALDDRESKLEGLEAGADDFLTKPFDSTELLIRLRTIARLNRFKQSSEARERFEHVVAYSPDGIVIINDQGSILLANPEFARIGKIDHPEDAIGQNFFDWINSADGARIKDAISSLSDENRSALIEVKFDMDPDSDPGALEITICQIPWDGTQALQLVLRDTTEKKRLEIQVMRFQRIELLGELASGVAHDMNNVLSAVSGNLSLMEMNGSIGDDIKARMATMRQSLQRGNGILKQLLCFTRGSDGTIQDVDLRASIQEVVDLITPMMKYEYQIYVTISDNLAIIQADPNQVHQILMNLCVNARDAMPKGGTLSIIALRISLTQAEAEELAPESRPGDFMVVHVRDTGTGIPPKVKARLFTPFFTTKEPGKGTGLGLATVLRLVRRHKGFITVSSVPNEGSCFSVYLPIAE